MPWINLQLIVSRLLGNRQFHERRQSPTRSENQTLHSRRELLAGLGVCALAGSSLLAPGRASATTLMSSAIEGLGRNADESMPSDAEFEHADLNQAELDEAEVIEVRRRRRRSGRRSRRRSHRYARRWRRRHYRRPRYYGRRRRRYYSRSRLRYLCRNYYFRRDFPLLCSGVNWWL